MHELPPILTQAIECFGLFNEPANKTLCERLGDVLSESHREDTSHEFRLGLLQGALAIGLPQLAERERGAVQPIVNNVLQVAAARPFVGAKEHPKSGGRAAQHPSQSPSRKRTRPAAKRGARHA